MAKNHQKWQRGMLTIGMCLAVASCTTNQLIDESDYPVVPITPTLVAQLNRAAPTPPTPASAATPTKPVDASVRLSAGDVLSLRLWDGMESPNVQNYSGIAAQPFTIRVEEDGHAAFPYVGTVHVAGKTTGELRSALGKMLTKYFRAPRFDLQVQELHSQHVLVSGAVMKPGVIDLGFEPLDIAKALDKVGGAQPYADLTDVTLVHADQTREHLNLQAFLYRADASQNPPLRAGDTLLFSENHRNRVFLMGDVLKPGAMAIPAGHLSLTEALNLASGPNNETATTDDVYVIRGAVSEQMLSSDTPVPPPADNAITIYRLPTGMPVSYAVADQFMLQPRDVVFVAAAPVTEWHRFISQLIPSTLTASKSLD